MTGPVFIAGSACRIGPLGERPMESVVRNTVLEALAAAGVGLDEVDTLVTCGSDILDGGMVATRSGIAGSYGHSLLTVPSSAGHALAAAVSMIESGGARNVLLAGWGQGSKFAEIDGRITQADPFYTRPLGAGALEMSAIQAQRLIASGRLRADAVTDHWLRTHWSDGACALFLTPESRPGRVRVVDHGSSFQPYCPEPDELDPARWVSAALAAMRSAQSPDGPGLATIEVRGPTALCEFAAIGALRSSHGVSEDDARINASGGGATAFFGPATGLGGLVAAAGVLRGKAGATGLVIDLAGPIGQETTVILLEGGSA